MYYYDVGGVPGQVPVIKLYYITRSRTLNTAISDIKCSANEKEEKGINIGKQSKRHNKITRAGSLAALLFCHAVILPYCHSVCLTIILSVSYSVCQPGALSIFLSVCLTF